MSIAAECSECCVCPTPVFEYDSASGSSGRCGYRDSRAPGVIFSTKTFIYTPAGAPCSSSSCDGFTPTIDETGGSITCGCMFTSLESIIETYGLPVDGICPDPSAENTYGTAASKIEIASLSSPWDLSGLRAEAIADLSSFSGSWSVIPASAVANLYFSGGSVSYEVTSIRYRVRFKAPTIGSGKCYRVSWIERFLAEAGVALTSLEVISPGVGRPTVTIAEPPSGGTQAYAVAVMSSTGTVSSIRILNPGSGYTTAPTVTVQTAINSGTTSTGWTATVTDGQVTAVTGGSAGNYLPTLAISGGGGTGATATATMDSQGGIATADLTAVGSGFAAEPALTITPKVSGSTDPVIHFHLGTETDFCTEWDGVVPEGYDPEDEETYPILPSSSPFYYEIDVPEEEGLTTVANLRAYCDCSACP